MSTGTLWDIRPMVDADTSMIYNSWLKSNRDAAFYKGVPSSVYYAEYHNLIQYTLSKPSVGVLVACTKDDPDQIVGYLVGEILDGTLTVHWTYVKQPFRGFGVAKALIDEAKTVPHKQVCYSTKTRYSSLTGSMVYNPFKLWSRT